VIIKTNSQYKFQTKVVNDNQNRIHDVVVVETNIIFMPLKVILAYVIVPNSLAKLDGPMITNVCDVRFKCKF
jgi:hypothetical protein